ncbi:MAG: hypothetical protein AAFR35_13790 [Pseudomonadota bacterium]
MDMDSARNAQIEILRDMFGFDEVAGPTGDPHFVNPRNGTSNETGAFSVVASAASAGRLQAEPEFGGPAPVKIPEWRPEDDVAIGIQPQRKGRGMELVALYQRPGMDEHELIQRLRDRFKAEISVRYAGRTRALSWTRERRDPLCPGLSVGHPDITAGTLGGFARDKGTGTLGILSNNHVLANVNEATPGDASWQRARSDGGSSGERVGTLDRFLPIDLTGAPNELDCAWSELDGNRGTDLGTIRDNNGVPLGQIAQTDPVTLNALDTVQKVGRTTGHTWGVVTAVNVMNLQVAFEKGVGVFQNVTAIQTTGSSAFSDGGDSGSIILTEDFRPGGLLFAGSKSGGAGNKGITYACNLERVLDILDLDLAI